MSWRLSAAAAAGPQRTTLRLAGGGAVVADTVEVAHDSATRRRGLLGRETLAATAALIVPTQGVHTFGMRFVIDVVFVDGTGRVVRICPHVPPRRVRIAWRAAAAVELCAGRAEALGLRAGQQLVLDVPDA